jgi:hypothetical protein
LAFRKKAQYVVVTMSIWINLKNLVWT